MLVGGIDLTAGAPPVIAASGLGVIRPRVRGLWTSLYNLFGYAIGSLLGPALVGIISDSVIHTFGDAHIYSNHLEQVDLQLSRKPHPLPTMKINPDIKDIFAFKFEDFELVDYVCDAAIKAPVAV